MPYITQKDKNSLQNKSEFAISLDELGKNCKTAGELNYTLTCIIQGYLVENGKNYQHMNDILGALEGAKLEFYRRIVANYEDTKTKINGDVMIKGLDK